VVIEGSTIILFPLFSTPNNAIREQGTWKGCIESIFGYLHNQTVNIHTHLWGAVIFLILLFATHYTLLTQYPTATWLDVTSFSIFLLAAIACLGLSATFHVSMSHSEKVSHSCGMFDYAGIVALIVGSFYANVYYGFYCSPVSQIIYLSIITIAGSAAAYVVLSPTYATPAYRWHRTLIFIALGLCALFPVTHAFFASGIEKMRSEMGLTWLVVGGALYISGALIYAGRVPERWYPGKFDYFFASHQIFHTHVVLAALAHYMCLLTAFQHRHTVDGGRCLALA